MDGNHGKFSPQGKAKKNFLLLTSTDRIALMRPLLHRRIFTEVIAETELFKHGGPETNGKRA
ncbi:MAG: hypothetical protein AB7E95_12625 [Kiritimatiellales bacterium]|jgi:hypothetical protein